MSALVLFSPPTFVSCGHLLPSVSPCTTCRVKGSSLMRPLLCCRHEALFLIPSYESVIVLQSALAGTLVNQDYRNRSWWEQTLYWFSIAIVIAGLSLLVVWPKWACNGEAEVAALNSCLLRERALNERSKLVKEGDAEQGRRDGCISRLGLGCCNGS